MSHPKSTTTAESRLSLADLKNLPSISEEHKEILRVDSNPPPEIEDRIDREVKAATAAIRRFRARKIHGDV